MFPRSEIKQDQKMNLKLREGEFLLVTLVYLALNQAFSSVATVYSVGVEFVGVFALSVGVLSIAMALLAVPPLAQGYRFYTRKLSDGKPGTLRDLFAPYADCRRIVKLQLWTTLFTFLWSLLFIIPGIVAAYRYRFATYILMDHPDITAKEALQMSAELTRGFKWDLFVLDLSFLGWNILCALTGVLILWIAPYQMAVEAEVYRFISFEKGEYGV